MLINIVTKGFMPITIAIFINYTCAIHTTNGERLANIFAAICIIPCFIVVPLMALMVIVVPKDRLLDPGFKNKYGSIYSNFKIETRLQRAHTFLFLLRRFLLIIIGLTLFRTPGIQC